MAMITNFNQQAYDQQMYINSLRNRQYGGGCGCGPMPGPWGPPQWSQGHGNLSGSRDPCGSQLPHHRECGSATAVQTDFPSSLMLSSKLI